MPPKGRDTINQRGILDIGKFYVRHDHMNQNYKTTPRLYVDHDAIASGSVIALDDDQTHYLKTVMRLRDGDVVRIFNGRNGEFASIWSQTGKKQSVLTVSDQLRSVPELGVKPRIHLFFPPIKKDRLDWLIEKSVELGVTDLHPVLTDHVVVRDIKPDRMMRQIIEASEQCERLTVPILHDLMLFKDMMNAPSSDIQLFVALERHDAPLLPQALSDV
jgi:16S rRNA (uracil1498-N3)-methyltransferase